MSQFVNNPDHKFQFDTLALHVGQEEADPASDSRAVPIYQTTSYVFRNSQHAADRFGLADAGNIYGRLTNSTQGVFEDRIAALEGGVAGLAVASGTAAPSISWSTPFPNSALRPLSSMPTISQRSKVPSRKTPRPSTWKP